MLTPPYSFLGPGSSLLHITSNSFCCPKWAEPLAVAPLAERWPGEPERALPLGMALLALLLQFSEEVEQVEAWTKTDEWPDREQMEKGT